jgi:hypothetical protein
MPIARFGEIGGLGHFHLYDLLTARTHCRSPVGCDPAVLEELIGPLR